MNNKKISTITIISIALIMLICAYPVLATTSFTLNQTDIIKLDNTIGSSSNYSVILTNNRNVTDSYNIWSDAINYTIIPDYVNGTSVASNASITITFTITPTANTTTTTFHITVKSIGDNSTQTIYVYVGANGLKDYLELIFIIGIILVVIVSIALAVFVRVKKGF